MSEEGVGLISVLQRIARALEDMDSILAVLTEETMDMHDTIKATNVTLNAITEELKVTSKLSVEQMRVLEITAPKR